MSEAFENISIFNQCVEFYTDTGEHVRAMNFAATWGIYIEDGDAFTRQGTVMRDETDEPRDIWDKFIGG